MVRKRKPAEDSDDDFAPSDNESLMFSRLKRPRRTQQIIDDSSQDSNPSKTNNEDDGQDIESLLESLQGHDSRRPPSPKPSVNENKEDSRDSSKVQVIEIEDNDFSKESSVLSKASSLPDSSNEIDPEEKQRSKVSVPASDEVEPSLELDASLPSRSRQQESSLPSRDDTQTRNRRNLSSFDIRDDSPDHTPKTRARQTKPQKRPRYTSSDSENGSSADDDDAYHSESDSPDEVGSDSEFELSPQKSTKKKPPAKAKGSPRTKNQPKKTTKNLTKSTPPARLKKALPVKKVASSKTVPKPKVKETPRSASNSKKRLGSRVPANGLLRNNTSNDAKRSSNNPMRVGGNAVFRAGLSRNAQIPRLHSYLSNK